MHPVRLVDSGPSHAPELHRTHPGRASKACQSFCSLSRQEYLDVAPAAQICTVNIFTASRLPVSLCTAGLSGCSPHLPARQLTADSLIST